MHLMKLMEWWGAKEVVRGFSRLPEGVKGVDG